MLLTLELPEHLAQRLSPFKTEVPHILELGLRAYHSEDSQGFQGMSEILDFLAGLPAPEEVLQLRPAPRLQARIHELLEKNRESGLTDEEKREWAHYEYLEHLVRVAKAKAGLKLQARSRH